MIQFMTPVLNETLKRPELVTLWARLWKAHRQDVATGAGETPTTKILDVIERVRGSEANLARFQMERLCRAKR